jgi:excisionase family DNA binding protein
MLTLGEIAKILKVSPSTVRKWSLNGRIPTTTTDGGHRRYILEDVLTALDIENPELKKKCLIYVNIKDLKENSKYTEMAKFYAKSNGWQIVAIFNDYTGKLNSICESYESALKLIIGNKINRIILPYKAILGLYGKQQFFEILCKIKKIKIIYLENHIDFASKDDVEEIDMLREEVLIRYKEQKNEI